MKSAKENILNRLRATNTQKPQPKSSNWNPRYYDQPKRLEVFKDALLASHAEVIETTEDEWPKQLVDIAASKHLISWIYNPSSPDGSRFKQQLSNSHYDISLTPYNQPIESFKQQLFNEIEASFTEAQAAIAETGTLVLLPTPDEPRLMSLVPPFHVVLLRESTLLNNFSELVAHQQWSTRGMPTNALLISGPSKTADIQQTLAYGAHGPKELIVLVVKDLAGQSAEHMAPAI